MKKLLSLLGIMFLVAAGSVSAANIVFESGTFKFTGDTYIDTTLPTETRAIGRVSTVTNSGTVIWTSGVDGYLSFSAAGFIPVVTPVAPLFNFVSTGGYIDFYLNDLDVFDPSLDWAAASTLINTGDLALSTVVVEDTIGVATGVSYSANGFLDVTGGSLEALIVRDTRPTFTGSLADLSFGLVGANNLNPNVNSDYQYITSSDVQGQTTASVPEPSVLSMLLLGLAGLGFTKFVSGGKKND